MRSKVTVVLVFLNVVLFAYIYWFDHPLLPKDDTRRAVLPTEIASMDSLTRTTRTGGVAADKGQVRGGLRRRHKDDLNGRTPAG